MDCISQIRESLLAAVDASQSEMIRFTQELVAIATENPPGNEYARCAQVIAEKLKVLGLEPQILETPAPSPGDQPGYCVIASYGDAKPVLYFHGHYDVVPHSVEGQFNPVIQGPNLFGRGSTDMKSGLAAMIYAVHALRRTKTPLQGGIKLIIVPDEETGGVRGAGALFRSADFGTDGIGMLLPEPTSGVVWNANRGAISLRITAKGKAAHVGLSHQGMNAFERMLTMARELEKLKAEVSQRETGYNIHPRAARRSILLLGGECRGGSNFNVVPESCSFTVDRRINPEEDLETEKHRLLDLFDRLGRQGIDHDIEMIQEAAAAGVSEEHPLARILAEAIEWVTGKRAAFALCPALLENRFYAQRGIPARLWPGPTLRGPWAQRICAHQKYP